MMDTTCPQGHEIRSSADRDGQGYCLACRADGAKTHRSRQSAAIELARALEARGVQVTRSQPPVNIQQLADALAGRLPADGSEADSKPEQFPSHTTTFPNHP
jgi:hypothetical protein